MVDVENVHLRYIEKYLMDEIVEKLPNESLIKYEAKHSGGLDGFMSALYNIQLTTKNADGSSRERLLIAKFMKGDVAFRELSKSYTQFANEVYIYTTVLPAFEQVLQAAGITTISLNDLVPFVFAAKFGYIEGLSASATEREGVLVLENLRPQGYTLGPRVYLKRDHLLSMCKVIGSYHAISYALRLSNESHLERLKSGIVPLPFLDDNDPNDVKVNGKRRAYRLAFDRFFDYFDRKIDCLTTKEASKSDVKLIERLRKLRERYFAEPVRLLEYLRTHVEQNEADRRFAAILHGDYNRNNVLFKYKNIAASEAADAAENAEVEHMKMIDFQELRYGTPAIDLSFFMFMNTSDELRVEIWQEMLHTYHKHMYDTLAAVLKSNITNAKQLHVIEQQLEKYKFEHFNAHFARFAFYGVMICIQFLPWMLCNESECARISELFVTAMHSEEFRKLSIQVGGDAVNEKILNIIRHACNMGYMDEF